jgi:outer membrane lipoprotein-sorting protein
VPVGAVAVAGIVVAATAAASASSTPSLPPRSAAQLLAEVAQASARPPGSFSATVQENSDLGLPALPSTGSAGSGGGPFGATSGTETTSIWYLNPQHVRVAVVTPMNESDLRLDGRTLWLWSSKTQTATRVKLPAKANVPARPPSGSGATLLPPTPQAAAQQLLTSVGPTTLVSVQRNVSVAGRPAYQLSLVPKSSGSLVGRVLIAIDASRHIPLRLEVIPRGSSSPAYEVGFTSLTFGPPAASNFTFTPPSGAKVKTVTLAGTAQGISGALGLGGLLGGALGGSFGAAGIVPGEPAVPAAGPARAKLSGNAPTVIGKSWLTVLATRPNRGVAGLVQALLSGNRKVGVYVPASVGVGDPVCCATSFKAETVIANAVSSKPTVSGEVVSGTSPGTAAPVGPDLAVLRALLKAMTPVHGSWGSGRLLRTSLLSVLVTSNGRILAGAVTPAVLYADAALPAK